MKRVLYYAGFLATLALVGCAGAGPSPEPTPSPTPAPTGRFEPNYKASLGAGRQWSVFNVEYYVKPVEGRDIPALFRVALSHWEPSTQPLFTFAPSTDPSAILTVEVVPTGSLGSDTVGTTTVTYRKSDAKIVRAVILVDAGLGNDLMPQVLTHELGHALGLDGHSPELADVMYARAHLPLLVTERDRNTFSAVYSDLLAALGRAAVAPSTKKDADDDLVTVSVCTFKKEALGR